MKTHRFPLFLQYSRSTIGLTDDQWFAIVLAVCNGSIDASQIYAAADKLGALNDVTAAYASLGARNPVDAVRIVYDRAVQGGWATWNPRFPAALGGVPTPFAKIPSDLLERLLFALPSADSLDFSVLALVATYDYQLQHRREFVKGPFRFSKKLASEATGAEFEDVQDTLDTLVETKVLAVEDGFYRLIGEPERGAILYVDGKEVGRGGKVIAGADFGFKDVPYIIGKTLD